MTFWEIQKIIPSETVGKRAIEVGVCSSREQAKRLMARQGWPDSTGKKTWTIGDYVMSRLDWFTKRWSWKGDS